MNASKVPNHIQMLLAMKIRQFLGLRKEMVMAEHLEQAKTDLVTKTSASRDIVVEKLMVLEVWIENVMHLLRLVRFHSVFHALK